MSKASVYNETQVRQWLRWLASNMQANSQTVFMVEDLQPSWLRKPGADGGAGGVLSSSNLYLFLSSSIYALPFAIFLSSTIQATGDIIGFLLTSFVITAIPAMGRYLSVARQWRMRSVVLLMLLCVPFEIVLFVIYAAESSPLNQDGGDSVFALTVILILLSGWIAASRNGRSRSDLIQPVESIRISLRSGWQAFSGDWNWWLLGPYFVGYRILKGLKGAIQPRKVALKVGPNRGIWLSLRNAITLLIPPLVVLVAKIVFPSLPNLLGAVAVLSMPICVYMSAHFGGMDFIDHFVLRLFMRVFGYAPWNYVRFLDYAATELGFLQKVGGGYIFMHRYLLEYFATMSDEEVAAPAGSVAVTE